MKAVYDADTDILTLYFKQVPIEDSDEAIPGVIMDFDAQGELVSMEILDASERVQDPTSITLERMS